ncbi:MAG: cytidine deaminase [Prevotella sp.]
MRSLQFAVCYNECVLDELCSAERQLVLAAMEATKHSYSPYSRFRVGAAVLMDGGQTITGSNQENSAYPVTLCAERVALFCAVHQHPDVPVTAIALAAQDAGGFTARPVTPCGSCRQVLAEMELRSHRPITILMYGVSGIWRTVGVVNLLPLAFDSIPSQDSQV